MGGHGEGGVNIKRARKKQKPNDTGLAENKGNGNENTEQGSGGCGSVKRQLRAGFQKERRGQNYLKTQCWVRINKSWSHFNVPSWCLHS